MPALHDPSTPAAAAAPGPWRRRVAGWALATLTATLVACGGGGGGVSTGGTGALSLGAITGFGSVIVNGVRYDDSGARVFDDDGNAVAGGTASLGLGMVVEVRGSVSDDGLTGDASSFVVSSEMKGPVTAVDTNAGTLTVFGQLVRVTPATVYEDLSGGLAGLAVGNVVEVHGLPDGTGAIVATRIEFEAATVAAYGGDFRVRGTVSGLSGSGTTLRFTVATVTLTTSGATRIDGTVADGAYVKVRLGTTAAGDGSYPALRVQVKERGFDDDIDEGEVEGFVAGFTSPTAPFTVNGYPVRLGASVVYEDGTAGDLVDGAHVEVKGLVEAGVLVVSKVEFKHDDAEGGEDGSDAPFEFKGVASCSPTPCGATGTFTLTTGTGRTFEIRYDEATRFDDGVTSANLHGFDVEVKAVADGTAGTFLATRIEPND